MEVFLQPSRQSREIEANRSNFYSDNSEANRSFRGGNIIAALVKADAIAKLSAFLDYSSSLDLYRRSLRLRILGCEIRYNLFETRVAAQRIPERVQFQVPVA